MLRHRIASHRIASHRIASQRLRLRRGWRSFERYCRSVEATAAWGGQLELRALAHVLRRRIVVYSAHLPTVEMGEEYRVEEAAPPLRVAYQCVPSLWIAPGRVPATGRPRACCLHALNACAIHSASRRQHAYGLGEHYNSVRQATRPDADAGDSD